MALFYSFVARGTLVLAEHAQCSGNFSQVALECLSKLSGKDSRFTYKAQEYLLNFLVEGGLTYLVVCEEGYPREICFYFLEQVQKEFKAKHEEKSKTAVAHAFDRPFGPRLKHYMEYCVNNPGEISKVHRVKAQVDEVKGIMVQNIEKELSIMHAQVLDRGERIEVLVDKTEDLRNQANKFQKQGRSLRNKVWWQNMKMKMLVLVAIILLALVIFCLVCFTGGNCLK